MSDEEAKIKTAESTKAETSQKKKPRFKLWQKIVGGIVAFFVLLIIIVNMAASGAVKASNQFVNDIQNRDASGAYSLFTREAAAQTDRQAFGQMVDTIGPTLNTKLNMTGKEVSGETGSAATATVTYEVKGTDNVTYVLTVKLQKEDGQWKVLGFDSTKK
jgi:ketosteroid isomerase-like protein